MASGNENQTLVPGQDATADFMAALQDPNRWVIKRSVPIFKAHERKDPATGKLISVDIPKLYKIAENMQRMERQGGVPSRLTLGHTEPGKPETEQPPCAGYYRNARVQPFGPSGELAIVADEYLDPMYASKRRNYPYRSSEYYDDTCQITGVALLTRDPFLDLGVVAYSRNDPWNKDLLAIRTAPINGPTLYSHGQPRPGYQVVLHENPTQYAGPNQYPNPWGQNANSTGTPMNNQRYSDTPYSAPWPGPAYHPHQIGHQHASGGAIYADTPQNNRRTMRQAQPQAQYDDANDAMFSDDTLDRMGNPSRGGPSARPAIGVVQQRPRSGMFNGNNPESVMRIPRQEDPPIRPNPEYARYSQQGNRMNGRGRPGRYADGPMPGSAMSGDPLQALIGGLQQALEAAEQLGDGGMGGPGTPPPGPFPQEGPGGPGGPGGGPSGMPPEEEEGPPQMNSRYSNQQSRYADQPRRPQQRPQSPAQRPQNYGEPSMNRGGRPQYARYDRAGNPPAPVPAAPARIPAQPYPQRTISGLPVGYQLELDKRDAEIRDLKAAMGVVFYERDQADTEACEAEIRRLAGAGFAVGEYELTELKNKPREHRAAYLQHIVTKYQKVGTEMPPQMMGDPTPGPAQDTNRPLTQQEMEAALKLASRSNDPGAFTEAVRYIRGGGQQAPTPYGPAFTGNPGYGQPANNGFGGYAPAPGSEVEEHLNGAGNPFAR